jgi:hypothetical protein
MDQVDRLVAQKLEGGAAKKNKSLGIVGIVAIGRAIKKLAIKVLIGSDQVDRDSFAQDSFKDRGFDCMISNRCRQSDARITHGEFTLQH